MDRPAGTSRFDATLPTERPVGSSRLDARLPLERPVASGRFDPTLLARSAESSQFEAPPLERPTGSRKFELPSQSKSEPPRSASKTDRPPSTAKLTSLGMLLEELGDMPSEDDRTNPWDVGDDEPLDEVTGATMPARRDPLDSNKRRRSSKP